MIGGHPIRRLGQSTWRLMTLGRPPMLQQSRSITSHCRGGTRGLRRWLVVDIQGSLRRLKNTFHHGLKERQCIALCFGVKRRGIIFFDELKRAGVVRMVLVLIAHIAIKTHVVKKVIPLKNAVMFHHPVIRFTHIRLE